MASKNDNTIAKLNGSDVRVRSAIDYGQCRAQHLAALARMVAGDEFQALPVTEQRHLLYLVDDLASEREALLCMVYDEGREMGEYATTG